MTVYSGNDGVVKIGANAATKVTGFTVDETAGTYRTDGAGEAWEGNAAHKKAWSGSLDCRLDASDTTGATSVRAGTVLALGLYPDGDVATRQYLSGNAVVTSVGRKSGLEADNQISINFTGDGALTIDDVSA